MRPTLREKNTGERNNILYELMGDDVGLVPAQLGDSASFSNFFRMSKADFEYILNIIGPTITKVETRLRKPISSTDRLAVTLRYLITGDSYCSLSYLFKISKQSISQIVPEVCEALMSGLSEYVKVRIM